MSKELVTKVMKRTGPGSTDWEAIPIGVDAENVILDAEQNISVGQIMKHSTGGRNYLADTDEKTFLCLEEDNQNNYRGLNEMAYSVVGNKTLEELGFTLDDYITLSFDWTVNKINDSELSGYSKEDTEIISSNKIIWVEDEAPSTDPLNSSRNLFRIAYAGQDYDDNGNASDGKIKYQPLTDGINIGTFINKTGDDSTKDITYERRVYTDPTAITSTTKSYVLQQLEDKTKSGHYTKTLKMTHGLLKLSSIQIQSPYVVRYFMGDDDYLVCYHILANFELVLKNVMLEKGRKASDWHPAAQDTREIASEVLDGIKIPIQTVTSFWHDRNINIEEDDDTSNDDVMLQLNGYCTLLNHLAFINVTGVLGSGINIKNAVGSRNPIRIGYLPAPLYNISSLSAIHTISQTSSIETIPLVGLIRRNDFIESREQDQTWKYYGELEISNPASAIQIGNRIWINGSYEIDDDTLEYFKGMGVIEEKEEESPDKKEETGTVIVRFNNNGVMKTIPVTEGSTIPTGETFPTPTSSGQTFNGWKLPSPPYLEDTILTMDTIILHDKEEGGTKYLDVVPLWNDLPKTEVLTTFWDNENFKTYTAANPLRDANNNPIGYWQVYTGAGGTPIYPQIGTKFLNGSKDIAFDTKNTYFYLSGSKTGIGATPRIVLDDDYECEDFTALITLSQAAPLKGKGRWYFTLNDEEGLARFIVWYWDKSANWAARPIYYKSINAGTGERIPKVEDSGECVLGDWSENQSSSVSMFFNIEKRGENIIFAFDDTVNGTRLPKQIRTITIPNYTGQELGGDPQHPNRWKLKYVTFHLQRQGAGWNTKVWTVRLKKITYETQ